MQSSEHENITKKMKPAPIVKLSTPLRSFLTVPSTVRAPFEKPLIVVLSFFLWLTALFFASITMASGPFSRVFLWLRHLPRGRPHQPTSQTIQTENSSRGKEALNLHICPAPQHPRKGNAHQSKRPNCWECRKTATPNDCTWRFLSLPGKR